jgi:hypothetical protein
VRTSQEQGTGVRWRDKLERRWTITYVQESVADMGGINGLITDRREPNGTMVLAKGATWTTSVLEASGRSRSDAFSAASGRSRRTPRQALSRR